VTLRGQFSMARDNIVAGGLIDYIRNCPFESDDSANQCRWIRSGSPDTAAGADTTACSMARTPY
jgi:hypothetical protein